MIWIALIAVVVIGLIAYAVHTAPEVSDDYEFELWLKYQPKRDDGAPAQAEKQLRRPDAAQEGSRKRYG